MKWENFGGNSVSRTRTPGGWLVRGFRCMAYVPDELGKWQVDNETDEELKYH